MNILTDEEIESCSNFSHNRYQFSRAIEAAVLSKLAEQDVEPVAWMCWLDEDTELRPRDAALTNYEPRAHKNRAKLYTEAQYIAAQQRTAEACAKVCENTTTVNSGEEFREGFRHAAKLIWNSIRNGDWREYL